MGHRWIGVAASSIAGLVLSGLLVLAAPHAVADPEPSSASSSESANTGNVDKSDTDKSDAEATPADKPTDDQDTTADEPDSDETASAVDEPEPKAESGRSKTKESTDDEAPTESTKERPTEADDPEPISSGEADDVDDVATPVHDAESAPETTASKADKRAVTVDTEEKDGTGVQANVTAAAVNTTQAAATAAPLGNVIGSFLLNVLMGFIHLIDGAPVLPAGSTVSVRSSTLKITLDSGDTQDVEADWYFPQDSDESTRMIYLQHGFMASGPMYSYTAANLAERTNSIVVAPSLSSNFLDPSAAWVGGAPLQKAVAALFVGDREALTQSASQAWGTPVTLPEKFVLVGHSAGGTLVTAVAGYLADRGALDDLVGVVMLDGVEPAGSHAVGDALAKLSGENAVPIYLISSQRYFWSRGGDMADKLQAARPDDFNGVGLAGGLHIDYLQGGNPLIQFGEYLFAGFSSQTNVDAAEDISVGWVNDLFTGTRTEGLYGIAGESISIDTSAGAAVATVLPLGAADRSPWDRLLDGFFTLIFDWAGNNVFVYDPL